MDNPRCILVVDDDPTMLRSVARIAPTGWKVMTSDSPKAALELLQETPVDVLMSDHYMPSMSGIELLMQAALVRPQTRRILMTSCRDVDLLAAAASHNRYFGFLPKPISLRHLLQVTEEGVVEPPSPGAVRPPTPSRPALRPDASLWLGQSKEVGSGELAERLGTLPILAVGMQRGDLSTKLDLVHVGRADEALKELDEWQPLLILVDEAVAAANGFSLINRLRAHPLNGRTAIAVAGARRASSEHIRAGWISGVDDYLAKPLHVDVVMARLDVARRMSPPEVQARQKGAGTKVVCVGGPHHALRKRLQLLFELAGFRVFDVSQVGDERLQPGSVIHADLLVVAADFAQVDSLAGLPKTFASVARKDDYQPVPVVVVSEGGQPEQRSLGIETYLYRADASLEGLLQLAGGLLNRPPYNLRIEERVSYYCVVEMEGDGDRGRELRSGFTFDISPGGAFVRTLTPFRSGTGVRVRFLLDDGDETASAGVVAWSNPYFLGRYGRNYPGMGIQFMGPAPKRLAEVWQARRQVKTPS